MKKKLFLIIILALEFIFFLFFALGKVIPSIQEIFFLNALYYVGRWLFNVTKYIMHGVHLDALFNGMFGGEYPNINALFAIVVFNLIFIAMYYLIFGLLTLLINKQREKRIRKIVAPYVLTTNEHDKFDYHRYLSRFPIKRIISLIIPLFAIFTFIVLRFDEDICLESYGEYIGILNISKSTVEPFFNKLLTPADFHQIVLGLMHNANKTGYIDIMNNAFGKVPWVEFILVFIGSMMIIFVWVGVFSLIHLLVAKPVAKHKANIARKNYVRKMELIEYRLHNKYKDETSIKSDDFMHIVETEQKEAAREIAKFKRNLADEMLEVKDAEEKKKAYYEEIGQGVTDLGISDSQLDLDSPHIEREVKYISEEEVDIILDEEPVIEIVEDEKIETSLEFGNNDIFFERYQPDDNEIHTIEEYSKEEYREEKVHEEVSEIVDAKENKPEEVQVDNNESKEDKANLPLVIEEKEVPQEENIEEEPKVNNEDKVEEISPQEEVVEVKEETIKEGKEIVTETINENESTIEVEVKKEEKEEVIVVSDDKIILEDGSTLAEQKKKVDPFAKYRNRKNEPGYGAKKVPSFKEMKEKNKE